MRSRCARAASSTSVSVNVWTSALRSSCWCSLGKRVRRSNQNDRRHNLKSVYHAARPCIESRWCTPRRAAVRCRGARQALCRRVVGRRRARPRGRDAANASACSGRTAPARPRRSRSSRDCSTADAGEVEVLGQRWGRDARRTARAARHPAAGNAARRQADGRGDAAAVPIVLSARARPSTSCSTSSSSAPSATPWVRQAVGRTEAAAGGGVRAGRRSRAAVSRRADHRARSAVAPPAVGGARALPAPSGGTILLTTHYMDEAQRLCDRVGIMDHGQADRARHAARAGRLARRRARRGVRASHGRRCPTSRRSRRCRASATSRSRRGTCALATSELHSHGAGAARRACAAATPTLTLLTTHSATLEDVFVSLTGRHLRDA